MPWPLSQDYNEAVQSPESSFADPELSRGEVATNALGLPMPCSGNFADVYRLNCPASKRSWAVKCFTRQIPGLQERYQQISLHLANLKLPFMVDFTFQDRGIQVRADWYPILKMQWVEGLTLNQFVKKNLDKPQVLDVLCQLWVKLTKRLREANMAHCDLQHGNVLLVPGSKAGSLAVRLVDYDGMCVPALTLLKSIEVGHPAFQHPQRLREGIYSLEVDRFSHLVIYTALRSLVTGGHELWQRYDNGDNLLFCQEDFQAPAKSHLFHELLKLGSPLVRSLAEHLIETVRKPLDQAPLLDRLVGGTQPDSAIMRRTEVRLQTAAVSSGQSVAAGVAGVNKGVGQDMPEPSPFDLNTMTEPGGGISQGRRRTGLKRAPSSTRKWSGALGVCVVALLLAGLVGLYAGGVFRVQTKEGVLVVQVNEPNADVYVDGEKVTVTWAAGGNKAEIRVKPGTRQVSVKKDGFTAYGREVTLADGGRQSLTARLERIVPAVAKTRRPEPPVVKVAEPEPPVVKVAEPEPLEQAPTGVPKIQAMPQLLVVSKRTGNAQIFLVNADGTGWLNLTNNKAEHSFPAWSPDGKKIAFGSNRDGAWYLYLMDADGTNVEQLTKGAVTSKMPSWSADGKKIAFVRFPADIILVMDPDGGNVKEVGRGLDPALSPDGKKILFAKRTGKGFRLGLMDLDGTNVQELNTTDNIFGHVTPAWSPDGKKVAWTDKVGGGMEIFVANADGKNAKQLTKLGMYNRNAAWSPDGKQIGFQHSGDGRTAQLNLVDADGRNLRVLLPNEAFVDDARPAWRPLEEKHGSQLSETERKKELKPGPKPGKKPLVSQPANNSRPFLVNMNGLGGMKTLEPEFFPPGWRKEGAFAEVKGQGKARFPTVPVSWYVLETELALHTNEDRLLLQFAEPGRGVELSLGGDSSTGKEELLCRLYQSQAGTVWWSGERHFNVGERLTFKLVVGDRGGALFYKDQFILGCGAWPANLTFRIQSWPNTSATIYRCSFREVTKKDLAQLNNWSLAQPELSLQPDRTGERIKQGLAGLGNQPREKKAFVPATTGMPLAWIPPGEFDMGSRDPRRQKGERKHRVRLTKGFWMGQYEVTQGEWTAVMGSNPSRVKGSPYLPVDWVSSEDATQFCARLTERERKEGRVPAGYLYRLPTEAEWEYACRAGSEEDFGVPDFWYQENSGERFHEVGEKPPNPWGLYDMHGNVWEWTLDGWYDYPREGTGIEVDPVHFGRPQTQPFIVRGGAWFRDRDGCRSSGRERIAGAGGYCGFRIVLGWRQKGT